MGSNKIAYLFCILALFLLADISCTNLTAVSSEYRATPPGKKKILALPAFHPSHIKNMINICSALAQDDNYNVTMILLKDSIWYDQAISQSKGKLNIAVNQYLSERFADEINAKLAQGGSEVNYFQLIVETVAIYFTNSAPLSNQLKAEKYDMFLIDLYPDQEFLATYLDIPIIVKIIGGPLEVLFDKRKPYHSSDSPLMRPVYTGMTISNSVYDLQRNFFLRLQNFALQFIIEGPFNYIYYFNIWKAIPEEYYNKVTKLRHANLTIYYGVEGLYANTALPPNHKFVYPLVKNTTKKEQEISPELQMFINKHEKIFVVAFGSTFVPKQEQLEAIFEFIASNNDYGFVVGCRGRQYFKPETFDIISGRSNVFMTEWFAQFAVLKLEKTKIFFTHAGYTSFLESIEAKTAMISLPLWSHDQMYMCEMIQAHRLGECLKYASAKEIARRVKIIEENGYLKDSLAKYSFIMKKKAEDPYDVKYWVDYAFEVGFDHLMPKHYQDMSFLEYFDIDVRFVFFSLVAIVIYLIVITIKFIVKAAYARIVGLSENKQLKQD